MHASLEQKGLHSRGLSTRDAGWSCRQVINLLAPGFKTPKAIPSISFIIYERLMAFTSQPADAPVELSPALADPETRQSRRRLPAACRPRHVAQGADGGVQSCLPGTDGTLSVTDGARLRPHSPRTGRWVASPHRRFLHGPRAVAKGCQKRR